MGDLLRHWICTSTYAEGDVAATTRAMKLVDVGDAFTGILWAGVPSLDLDIPSVPAALVRCILFKLLEEPSCAWGHPEYFLKREPRTSQNMKAIQRLPTESSRGIMSSRRNEVFEHA